MAETKIEWPIPLVCYVCTEAIDPETEAFTVAPWPGHVHTVRHSERCPWNDREFPKEVRG